MKSWDRFKGKQVVVDTNSSFAYIGKFVKADPHFVELDEADVHDRAEAHATNERYVMDTTKFGLKPNRKKVFILKDKIVSISLLEDIIVF